MLSKSQIRYLRSQAHHLHPVVMIGAQGLTEAVDKEIALALHVHELVKIKLGNIDDDSQSAMIEHIVTLHSADFVQKIGHTAIFYRHNPKNPKYRLPK